MRVPRWKCSSLLVIKDVIFLLYLELFAQMIYHWDSILEVWCPLWDGQWRALGMISGIRGNNHILRVHTWVKWPTPELKRADVRVTSLAGIPNFASSPHQPFAALFNKSLFVGRPPPCMNKFSPAPLRDVRSECCQMQASAHLCAVASRAQSHVCKNLNTSISEENVANLTNY